MIVLSYQTNRELLRPVINLLLKAILSKPYHAKVVPDSGETA
jgi:hypothetical protein